MRSQPTSIRLRHLARKRHVHRELAIHLPLVTRPLVSIQEILVAPSTPVEEVHRRPVVQCVRTRLVDRSPRQGKSFLHKASKRRDALQVSARCGSRDLAHGAGSIMITGTFGDVGNLNVDRLTCMGTLYMFCRTYSPLGPLRR